MCRYFIIIEKASRLQKRIVDDIDELYMLRRNIYHCCAGVAGCRTTFPSITERKLTQH